MSQTEVQLIKADAVQTTDIANSAVTDAKISALTSSKLTGALPAISGASLTNLPASGKAHNLIINGAMQVAQRGTSSTSSGYHTVDRFQVAPSGLDEAATQAQVDVASGTTPYTLGFRKAFKVTNGNQTSGAGSGDNLRIIYKVEAQDLANSGWNYTSASSYITLSFWVKSSVAQNFYVQFRTRDTPEYNYTIETGSLSADTWTKVTKTIPGNSNLVFNNDNGTGTEINFWQFIGTDYTGSMTLNQWGAYSGSARTPDMTSTWYTTNDATFEITGVQLEVGSVATDFEHRSFGDELLKCQRYYQIGPSESAPGVLAGRGAGTSAVFASIPLICTMRAVPSLSESVLDGVYAYTYNSRPQASSGTVTTNSSSYNAHGGYLNLLISGFGGNITDDRIVNIGGFATGDKIILNAEL